MKTVKDSGKYHFPLLDQSHYLIQKMDKDFRDPEKRLRDTLENVPGEGRWDEARELLLRKGMDALHFLLFCSKNKSFQLISCLGVFPYEWCTSLEKIRRAKELPSQEEFYDKLRGSELGNADYEHAQRVWNTFKCQSMRDYLEVKCFLNFCF